MRRSIRSLDAVAQSVAVRQDGLIARSDLPSIGFTRRHVWSRVDTGRWFRVHPGVWSVGHPPLTVRARRRAAQLAVGGVSAVSGWGAACTHGMLNYPSQSIEVLTDRRHRPLRGARVRTSRTLVSGDIVEIDGIPVLSRERTLVELADVRGVTQQRLENLMSRASFRDPLDARTMRDLFERNRNRRGFRKLLAAWTSHTAGSGGVDSGLEQLLFDFAPNDGEQPVTNLVVATSGGEWRCDLVYPRHGVVVEADGYQHGRASDQRRDADKIADLVADGWDVVRLPDLAIRERQEACRVQIRAALTRARDRGRAAGPRS